jgi:hypothetical protein
MARESKPIDLQELLRRYPTRETKIQRIREIEKKLEKMELDDEQNDPKLIEGHIRLTRGYRGGCGVFLLCLAAMSYRVYIEEHLWARYLVLGFGLVGVVMLLRAVLYRPDPKIIQAAYKPHRGTPEYRGLVDELDNLARALSQDLRSEDQ